MESQDVERGDEVDTCEELFRNKSAGETRGAQEMVGLRRRRGEFARQARLKRRLKLRYL